MQPATTFDELQTLTESKFKLLNLELESLSYNFSNIPLTEYVKNKILEKQLKIKAGWYACLVNRNIDVLLLPEYFNHNQTRNILIKKETDAYNVDLERFKDFKKIESNLDLYKNFFKTIESEDNSFNLFSTQKIKKENCPEPLRLLFEKWEQPNAENYIQAIVLQFYEWHATDNFSFSGKRQILIWLNYKLWKKYGLVAQLIDIEYFLFNNWNKENRSCIQSILDITDFIHEKIETLSSELKLLYREEIDYNNLLPQQKIANNYLFNQNFDIKLNSKVNTTSDLLYKIILKKGFLTYSDLPLKVNMESLEDTFRQWHIEKSISVDLSENNWFINLKPQTSEVQRLHKFNNVEINKEEINWKFLLECKNILPIKKEATPIIKEVSTFELKQEIVTIKAKAFFG